MTTRFYVSPTVEARVRAEAPTPADAAIQLQRLTHAGTFDAVAVTYTVEQQCTLHAGLDTEALAAELRAIGTTVWRPPTCSCRVMQLHDKRLLREKHVHRPIHHPDHTVICEKHQHHRPNGVRPYDPVAHRNELIRDVEQFLKIQQEVEAFRG